MDRYHLSRELYLERYAMQRKLLGAGRALLLGVAAMTTSSAEKLATVPLTPNVAVGPC